MKKIKGFAALALAGIAVAGLGACGKKENKLIVVTNAEFPPFEYDGDQGFDMDLIRKYGESVGKEIEIQDIDFDAALLAVQQGKADIAIAGITKNADREKVLAFSDAYYASNQLVSTKTGTDLQRTISSATTVDDINNALAGKKIGVQRGTTGQYYVEGSEDWDFAGITGAECKTYDNGGLAMKDLNDGKIDAVILDEAPTKSIVSSKFSASITVCNNALTEEEYAIAVNKDNQDLVKSLNDFIKNIKTNGFYDELINKYFGEN